MATDVRLLAWTWRVRCRFTLLGLLALLTAGCVAPGGLPTLMMPWDHPDERPSKIMAYWERSVKGAPDTKSQPMQLVPCLAGRVYFFGADPSQLITPRGKLVVNWYDMSGPPDGPHALLGECVYDPDSLQKMRSTNLIGVGYTVVAPWYNYRPDISRIKIVLAFLPEKNGDPVYAEPAVVALQQEGLKVLRSHRQEMLLSPTPTPFTPQAMPQAMPPASASPIPQGLPAPLKQ